MPGFEGTDKSDREHSGGSRSTRGKHLRKTFWSNSVRDHMHLAVGGAEALEPGGNLARNGKQRAGRNKGAIGYSFSASTVHQYAILSLLLDEGGIDFQQSRYFRIAGKSHRRITPQAIPLAHTTAAPTPPPPP